MSMMHAMLLLVLSSAGASAHAASSAAQPTLFACETYARHDFYPTGDGKLVAEYSFEPEKFGVMFFFDREMDPPGFRPKVAASLNLFNDHRSANSSQVDASGRFRIGAASTGDLPNVNHEDQIEVYYIAPNKKYALASIVQEEWLHGDKGRFLERTYAAKCNIHYGSGAMTLFESMDR